MSNSLKIKFKKIYQNVNFPVKSTEKAGAYDIYCHNVEYVNNNYVICKLGFSTEIPENHRVMITPRSSLTKENWYIPNSPGIIDSDYRNEWQVRFRCVPTGVKVNQDLYGELVYDIFPYSIGDRIAQLHVESIIEIDIEQVDKLESSSRLGGYGSTGK